MSRFIWNPPFFVATSTVFGTANVTPSISVNTPSGMQAGDMMVCYFTTNKDAVTPASGWTQQANVLATTNLWQTFAYTRIADATDVAVQSYTWSTAGTTAAPAFIVISAYRNVDPNNMVFSFASDATGGATAETGPSVTTSVPSCVVHFRTIRIASATIPTFTETSTTERWDGGNHGASTAYSGVECVLTAGLGYTTAIGSISGLSTTVSATPTDSVSATIALGATQLYSTSPNQAMNRSASY